MAVFGPIHVIFFDVLNFIARFEVKLVENIRGICLPVHVVLVDLMPSVVTHFTSFLLEPYVSFTDCTVKKKKKF